MHTLANSENPEEMSYIAAFHEGLHCLLGSKQSSEKHHSSEKEIQFYIEIITCDPSKHTMDNHKFIASTQKEESIS